MMKKYLVLVVTIYLSIASLAWSDLSQLEIANTSEQRYGAHLDQSGWAHFVVYAPAAEKLSLLLFANPENQQPARTIAMHKQGSDWKVKIRGPHVRPGLAYMFQAHGKNEIHPKDSFGLMFNPHYYLNDPYAYLTQNVKYSSFFAALPFVDRTSPVYAGGGKSILYDHSKDRHPGYVNIAKEDLVVYELHVQDYTARIANLDPSKRGTYLGLAQSGLTTPGGLKAGIDHLVELGVNAVELMPVMEYDEETGNLEGRYNHWGYMTTNFFTPEPRYAAREGQQVIELKELVRAFHERGIAVFLDVVYNHTAEQSPWTVKGRLAAKYYNAMGLHNTEFYRSTPDGKYYFNNTGTGNDVTFRGGQELYTKKWVRDSLAMWHREYGIDGFRFDLARILADGSSNAADWIDNDPRFGQAHLHAEPWDMGGQWWDFMDSGGWDYTNNRWSKWLGKYRDNIRRLSASNLKQRRSLKQLIEGYGATAAGFPASSKPWRSVNMLTCHDGYTLRDVTYFNDFDGSHNCWDSNGDENLRRERQKFMMGVLLTSQGVPLILQGDEFGRTKSSALTQDDAHNTYNYESSEGDMRINHVNWIDWRLKDGDNSASPNGPTYGNELFHWTKDLIQLRKQWSHFRRRNFPTYDVATRDGDIHAGRANDGKFTYIWENKNTGDPSQLGVIWWGKAGEPDLMVIYNEHWQELTVNNLQHWSGGNWKVLARSWYGNDWDFGSLDNWASNPDAGNTMQVKGRSLVILISDNN